MRARSVKINFLPSAELQNKDPMKSMHFEPVDCNAGPPFKGKKLTYKPLLVPQKDNYEPLVRCKINTEGRGACRCWNNEQERIDMPEDLRDCMLVPRV